MKFNIPVKSKLLSHSAMNKFLGCPKKYAYHYIDHVEVEQVDTTAMDRGRAFHMLLEHDGDVPDGELLDELDRDLYELAKTKAAYRKLKSYQDRKLVPVLETREMKIISEEHQFIGYCDSIGVNDDTGKWMLGEMKTTSAFDPQKWNLLAMNTQISLYKNFCEEFAHENFLDQEDFSGVSYVTVTYSRKKPGKKSTAKKLTKASRRADETASEYQTRIKDDSEVYHKIVDPTPEAVNSAVQTFNAVKQAIHDLKGNSGNAIKNTENCFAWHRPCQYFSHCHGIDPFQDEETIKNEATIENDMG